MILGVMGALAQTDVRRMFGFVVISGVGVMLSGWRSAARSVRFRDHPFCGPFHAGDGGALPVAGVMRQVGGSFLLTELGGGSIATARSGCPRLPAFLAAAGLPPGSGLWPKVMLAKASIEAGEGGSPARILRRAGCLTTITLGRVFLLAFWRDAEAGAVDRRRHLLEESRPCMLCSSRCGSDRRSRHLSGAVHPASPMFLPPA